MAIDDQIWLLGKPKSNSTGWAAWRVLSFSEPLSWVRVPTRSRNTEERGPEARAAAAAAWLQAGREGKTERAAEEFAKMAAFSGAWWEAEGLWAALLGPQGASQDYCCGGGVGRVVGDRRDVAPRGPALFGRGGRFRPGFFPWALPGNRRRAACSTILQWALPPPASSRPWHLRSRSPGSCPFDVAGTHDISGLGQAKQQLAWGRGHFGEKDDCPV